MSKHPIRTRFWFEAVCGTVGTVLFLGTLATREWIELIFGVDPDGGSGTLEFAIASSLLAFATCSSWLALRMEKTGPDLRHRGCP